MARVEDVEKSRDLLLEIGTEELPARFCQPALEQLKEKATAALASARLRHGDVQTFGTPRRLVLLVEGLALRQEDLEVVSKGPPARVAYDAAGKPTKAAEGFARKENVPLEALYLATEGNTEYLYARRTEVGSSIVAVLPEMLKQLILGLEWPKSMRWADRSIRFARPLKWICAMLGDRRVPFDVDGIPSGSTTRGHRFLAPPEPIEVVDPQDYFAKVGHAWVLLDQTVRRNVIWQKVEQVARDLGGTVPRDEDLLDEVNFLVEQPWPFAGNFDPRYLRIPAEVLVTSMREHQRYFPVYGADGKLLPHFIAVRNGLDDHLANVIAGNEKVLNARLADANFFFEEDRKHKLEDRLPKLQSIVFQEKLGTLAAKVERVESLARRIAEDLAVAGQAGYTAETVAHAVRAAHLCKADLVTQMVYEFTELQGVMGQHYAAMDGEAPEVARAIFEHYLPRGLGDELPGTPAGVVVALADKLDTLAGFFSVGLVPTGSADPFALRRAAQGVVQVLVEHKLPLQLSRLIGAAVTAYAHLDAAAREKGAADLLEFFRARLKVLLEDRGVRYDVVEAVLAGDIENPAERVAVAEALGAGLQEPEFAAVMGAFRRVANLGAKAEHANVDPALFQVDQERHLWTAFQDFRSAASPLLASNDYPAFYRQAVSLKAPVDAFLDKVLVMADDPAVRGNRLALLRSCAELLSAPADLSKLVVG